MSWKALGTTTGALGTKPGALEMACSVWEGLGTRGALGPSGTHWKAPRKCTTQSAADCGACLLPSPSCEVPPNIRSRPLHPPASVDMKSIFAFRPIVSRSCLSAGSRTSAGLRVGGCKAHAVRKVCHCRGCTIRLSELLSGFTNVSCRRAAKFCA